MKRAATVILGLALIAAAFGQSAPPDKVQAAQQRYQANGDYASLVFLSKQLRRGMTKAEVRKLLGEPGLDFDDHEHFSSDRDEYSRADGVMMHKVLTVTYDREGAEGRVTDWGFDLIGE